MYQKWRSDVPYLQMLFITCTERQIFQGGTGSTTGSKEFSLDLESEDLDSSLGFTTISVTLSKWEFFWASNFLFCKMRGRMRLFLRTRPFDLKFHVKPRNIFVLESQHYIRGCDHINNHYKIDYSIVYGKNIIELWSTTFGCFTKVHKSHSILVTGVYVWA